MGAARYNGPVYLLGSTLHHPMPRDCDIRIVVHDHEFAARYGMEMKPCDIPPTDERHGRTAKIMWSEEPAPQRWVDDVAKFTAALSVKLATNVDLQVWPESYWHDRIYPEPILLASPSPHWFIYNAHVPQPTFANPEE